MKHMKSSISLVIGKCKSSHEIPCCTHENGYLKKKRKITNVGKGVDKLQPLCITGGNVKWYRPYGKQFSGSSVVKHRTTR